ncbi:MAG TPA: pitrilysin family protein [Bacteroidia bacterium]|nr:pitrilysin family protein [Bacteroidia bacterium]
MNLNRTITPELKVPEAITILKAEKIQLDNGLSIYVINAGNDSVVKFEIIFPTGATDSDSYALSSACHQLTETGTSSKKAIEIAENLDYFGAFLQSESGPDFKGFSLFSLSRFFQDTLPILNEILEDAIFPEQELSVWKTRSIQSLKVNSEKVSWLSKTSFNQSIYGKFHPYGYAPVESSFSSVTTDLLRSFFKNAYPIQDAIIIVSGKVDEPVLKTINSIFGTKKIVKNEVAKKMVPLIENMKNERLKIEKKDAVQSAIRIGKKLFGKDHPDYLPMSVVNTILGGYFGSRLMSNIREEKGYTYGIGSGMHPFKYSGSFFISTEVGTEVYEATITEIYKELQRLIDEPVGEEELSLVKSYLTGSFLRSLDGPFSLADRFKGLILHGLDYDFLEKYLGLLHTMTPAQITEVAGKHLKPESMTEIVVG